MAAETGSLWNSAGTWEERNTTKWMTERVKSRLLGVSHGQEGSQHIKVTEVSSCTGDARILFLRGKKRAGFELGLSLKWRGEIDGQPVSGTVKIEEISESSLDDFDFEVSTTSEEPLRRKVKEHAKGLRKSISAVFTEIVEEMKSAW